jgi:topoisomerase-4 subunit A
LEQIATQMRAKKLPMVEDLRDESDHEHPTRLVIVMRSARHDVEAMMSHLFATTELERTYRVNLNMIGLDQRPQVKDLRAILQEWLTFREAMVRKRLQFRLDRLVQQLHILDGLLIAYLNIDAVIAIIRSEDRPKPVLMERFSLSDTQAEAILDLRLRRLGRLQEIEIRTEQRALRTERHRLEKTLASTRRLQTLLKKEIAQDAAKYGDARRSPLVVRQAAQALDDTTLVTSEPVTVILSEKGWVRAAKGHDVDPASLSYKAGDQFRAAVQGKSTQLVVFLDTSGRTYSVPAHTLPSARGQGEPLSGQLSPPDGASFVGLMLGNADDLYVLATDLGYGFVAALSDLYTRQRAGKVVLSLPQDSHVLPPVPVQTSTGAADRLAIVTNTGRLLVFTRTALPRLARGKGVKLIGLTPGNTTELPEVVVALTCFQAGQALTLYCGQRHLTLKPADVERYAGARGRRGAKLPRGFQRVDRLSVDAQPAELAVAPQG